MAYATTTITMASCFCNERREEVAKKSDFYGTLCMCTEHRFVHTIRFYLVNVYFIFVSTYPKWMRVWCVYHLTFLSLLFFWLLLVERLGGS